MNRTVQPTGKFSRRIDCVPDKSITHRALLFNAIATGQATVRNILRGEDCLSTADCLRRLGARIEIEGSTAHVVGTQNLRSAELYCGNSGTTMRLLSGLLAGRQGQWRLTGDAGLSLRPMRRISDPLSAMGGTVRLRDGHAPIEIEGGRLHGIDYAMPVASAQVKSALILAALSAEGTTRITESVRTRDHTERMLSAMGVRFTTDGNTVSLVGGQVPQATDVNVAGDISSAAFPLVCGLVTGGTVTVRGVGLNPTRTGLLEVFDQVGADYAVTDRRNSGGEETGDITVYGLGAARPFSVDGTMLPRLVDELPVLAVLACFLSGDSTVTQAGELRVKESDRIAASCRLVRGWGGEAEEQADGFTVRGKGYLPGGTFSPAGDHRMAMAAAVAAAASRKGGTVADAECVAVSYPGFWDLFS